MFFISPIPEALSSALESWSWLDLNDKTPILVTAFADVFFESTDGEIWFLDSLDGHLKKICECRDDLVKLLQTEEGQDTYLLAGFVQKAVQEGNALEPGECYDFIVNPVLGGAFEYDNIAKQDFVVALNVAGQLHDQIRNLPDGTKIDRIVVDGEL